jgi:hypothetical protein
MVDSVGGINSTNSAGTDGNSASRNEATTQDLSSNNTGSVEQSMTTADRLMSSPTTAEKLSGSLTTADVLSGMQTLTDKIANSKCLQDGIDLSKKIHCDGSLYANSDKSIQIGHGRLEYTPPNATVDSEKLKASASVGLEAELTAFDGKISIPVGEIGSLDARYRLGTLNGHAKAEAKAEYKGLDFKKSGASLNASVGGEALKWDARYSFDASITPKSVGDTLSGIYNNYVDPVVDYLAGRDVAEIPPVPDYLDHGIVIGGHVVVGEGVSGKFGGSVEIGNGQLFKMSARRKFGVGQVFGNGITFGVK